MPEPACFVRHMFASCCVLRGRGYAHRRSYRAPGGAGARVHGDRGAEERLLHGAGGHGAAPPGAEQFRMQRVCTRLGMARALLRLRLPLADTPRDIFSEADSAASSEEPL